jgi:signal transduction histidine kinase
VGYQITTQGAMPLFKHPLLTTNMNPSNTYRMADIYLAALRSYLQQGTPSDTRAAHDLGSQALASGLDTLDLARIHDQTLLTLLAESPSSVPPEDLTRRAEVFFTEAIMPIEGTHRLALEAATDMQQASSSLERRTLDLADSRRVLREQIAGRRIAEDALRINEDASSQLLKDSRMLEEHLQGMARKVLSANEAERRKMSLQLNDEIVQSLLAINLRMLALKKEVADNHADLTREIAVTQRLVEDSAQIIRHLADEFSI